MEDFLDWQGIMDPEIIPEDNMVNKEMNQVFTCLWKAICLMNPEKCVPKTG
jgi:hypothetical protein